MLCEVTSMHHLLHSEADALLIKLYDAQYMTSKIVLGQSVL